MTYDPAKDSKDSYDAAIEAMRERLESFRCERVAGLDVRIFNRPEEVVTIYGVRKDASSPYVYIGSTNQPLKARIRCHLVSARDGSHLPFHEWIRANFAGGIDVVVLEQTTADRRERSERAWMKTHSGHLLNVTDGGPGLSGHKFAGTDHAKRIGAAIASGGTFICGRCGSPFYRKVSAIERGHNKYCSRFCSNARRRRAANVEA